MPAAIRVLVPNAPPLYQWIESAVIRIGSHCDCDIQVRGGEPHIATVAFRAGNYYLINRSSSALTLAKESVAPGSQVIWKDGTELALAGDLSLALIRHPDPSPLNGETGRQMPAFDAPSNERSANLRRRKEIACFLVTVMAIFLTAFMSRAPRHSVEQQEYARIVRSLSQAPHKVQQQLGGVVDWVQAGYSVEQRGEFERARHAYLMARDRLMETSASADASDLRHNLLSFITRRIANM
jgi:hypothetical protein